MARVVGCHGSGTVDVHGVLGLTSAPVVEKRVPEALMSKLWWIYLGITAFTYALARLFIMAEVFRTLYFLPSEGYIATWSNCVPGIQ